MSDVWNKDPAAWQQMPLNEQLEAMRKWHCTGPCGQSSATMGTRRALEKVIQDAKQQHDEIQRLKAELSDINQALRNAFTS